MTHSFRLHFFHIIWSTTRREPLIEKNIQSSLYAYMGGIIKKYSGNLLQIGGMQDHVHLLIELSRLDTFSDMIRDTKASSSLWVRKKYPHLKNFAWQEGFGSFSVSYSSLESVQKYIQTQPEHHTNMSFEDEYRKFLERHKVKHDERFVFG